MAITEYLPKDLFKGKTAFITGGGSGINLALEWGKYGIRSNTIVSGPIEGTEGVRRLGGENYADQRAMSIPLGRFGKPEEIGQAAAFLASPLASYVTGTVLVVDGGQNLAGSAGFARAIESMMGGGAKA